MFILLGLFLTFERVLVNFTKGRPFSRASWVFVSLGESPIFLYNKVIFTIKLLFQLLLELSSSYSGPCRQMSLLMGTVLALHKPCEFWKFEKPWEKPTFETRYQRVVQTYELATFYNVFILSYLWSISPRLKCFNYTQR